MRWAKRAVTKVASALAITNGDLFDSERISDLLLAVGARNSVRSTGAEGDGGHGPHLDP